MTKEKDMKQPKRAQNPSKIIDFYASQKYPNIYRPPEKTVENYPKSSKVTLKTTKNLTKFLIFKHRNMHLISGPSQLAYGKII
jgi:hypothetical protein